MAQTVHFQTMQTLSSLSLLILLFTLRRAAYLLSFHQDRLVYQFGNNKKRGSKSWSLNTSSTDILDQVVLLWWGQFCALQGRLAHPGLLSTICLQHYPVLPVVTTYNVSRRCQISSAGWQIVPGLKSTGLRHIYVSLLSSLLFSPSVPAIEGEACDMCVYTLLHCIWSHSNQFPVYSVCLAF